MVSGGFPCQDISAAGRGQESGEREAGFGLRWRGLSVKYDRATCGWKTHHCLFQEDLPESSVTLPNWGLMRDGELWERTTPALPTGESGSGYWPTPTQIDATLTATGKVGSKGRHAVQLSHLANSGWIHHDDWGEKRGMWPTPRASEFDGRGGANRTPGTGGKTLSQEVRKWPTPAKSMMTEADLNQARFSGMDPRRPSYEEAKNTDLHGRTRTFPTPQAYSSGESNTPGLTKLDCMVRGLYPTPRTPSKSGGGIGLDGGAGARSMMTETEQRELCRGQLNPMWVEWLMGWPIGWTGLEPLETGRYQEWLDWHGGF